MSITDELRRVAAKTECANGRCEKLYRGDLDHIADRIDAEHESACAEAYGNGVQSVALPDMTAYVKLPVDADGVPIRMGDVMEHNGVVANVLGITFHGTTPPTVCIVRGDCWVEADELRHHHKPTVEDVLREFAEKIIDSQIPSVHPTYEEAIAEYTTKLRVAGDE